MEESCLCIDRTWGQFSPFGAAVSLNRVPFRCIVYLLSPRPAACTVWSRVLRVRELKDPSLTRLASRHLHCFACWRSSAGLGIYVLFPSPVCFFLPSRSHKPLLSGSFSFSRVCTSFALWWLHLRTNITFSVSILGLLGMNMAWECLGRAGSAKVVIFWRI